MSEKLAQLKQKGGGGNVNTLECEVIAQSSGNIAQLTFYTNSEDFQYNKVTCISLNNTANVRVQVDNGTVGNLTVNQSLTIPSFTTQLVFRADASSSSYAQTKARIRLEKV